MKNNELYHHGILNQKWGEQNGPPYPLDSGQKSRAEKRAEKKDLKWANKNADKLYKKAYSKSKNEMTKYANTELASKYYDQLSKGKISKSFTNDYNRKLADLMTQASSDVKAPSGKVVRYVAKRGDVGVYMALADEGYDMSQVKNGVWNSGKIAYKKKKVNMA